MARLEEQLDAETAGRRAMAALAVLPATGPGRCAHAVAACRAGSSETPCPGRP